jgi:diguanylate cyclase (GGDEF)-like protein
MDKAEKILQSIRINEEIARKFFEIEINILSVLDLRDLFEKLLLSIEEKFEVPHVWISIIGGNNVSHFIEELESSKLLKERLNLVGRGTFNDLTENKTTPTLVNEDMKPFYKLLPKNHKYFIKSLAVAPIILKDKIIGSLNLGDYSVSRFKPNMDTFFLSQLAVKVSICLANIIAREELKRLITRDPVTGLLNREEMERALEREFRLALRYGVTLTLFMAELDNIETAANAFGSDIDELMRRAADFITETIGEEDMAFGFSENKFAIILIDKTREEAQKIQEKLSAFLLENPVESGENSIPASINFGLSTTEGAKADTSSHLIEEAASDLCRMRKVNGFKKFKKNALKSLP